MWSEIGNSVANLDGYTTFLIILLFLGMVVIFERLFMLQFTFNLDFNKFLNNLKKMIRAEDFDRAISLCRNTKRTSLPYISLKAIEAAETDPSTVRGVIDEESIDFLPRIEARLGFIPAMATLTMLVGILGTIDALWNAFHSIDVLDTAQKQASVGHGIAGSLTYTSIGLIIAMILLAAHQMLKGMAIRLTERIHYGVAVLTNLLAPQDVAIMSMGAPGPMPSAMTMAPPMGGMDASEGVEMSPPPAAEESADEEDDTSDDDFDDASVEDIKDEEEII